MRPSRRFLRGAIASAFALLAVGQAGAVAVTPGSGAVGLSGTSVLADPTLAGTLIADMSSHWLSADDPMYGFAGAEGTLEAQVVRETVSGTLDFYWKVSVNGPSYPSYVPTTLSLSGLPLSSLLTGASFDANYLSAAGCAAPSGAASVDSQSITFSLGSSLGPGGASCLLLLRSGATDYDSSATAALGVSTFATFAPAATPAIPEPRTAWLLLAALAALAVVRRTRGDRA